MTAAGFQKPLFRIRQQIEDAVVEAEVADVIADDDVHALGQRELERVWLEELGPIGETRRPRPSAAQSR